MNEFEMTLELICEPNSQCLMFGQNSKSGIPQRQNRTVNGGSLQEAVARIDVLAPWLNWQWKVYQSDTIKKALQMAIDDKNDAVEKGVYVQNIPPKTPEELKKEKTSANSKQVKLGSEQKAELQLEEGVPAKKKVKKQK